MSKLESSNLRIVSRMTKSSVIEDKKSDDAVVETQFEGEVGPGAFSEYSSDLETMVFTNRCWEAIKCGTQVGKWVMSITDPNSGAVVAELKDCVIKDLKVKVGKEDAKLVTVIIAHAYSTKQKAIECAVSTVVDMALEKDTELLPGLKKNTKTDPEDLTPEEVLGKNTPDPEPVVTEIIDDDSDNGQVPLGEETSL